MTSASGPSLRNPLAETLRAGKLGLAMIVKQVQSVDIAVAAKTCGYDALNVDLEHSVISEAAAAQICITALHVGITPLVRIPEPRRLLRQPHPRCRRDGHRRAARQHGRGGAGDRARLQVRALTASARSQAAGRISASRLGRQSRSARLLNETTTVIVMLESPEAVENAEEIAAVPGVDILHIGTTDLCDALGIPGKFADPQIERAFERVIAACRKHGKVAGAGGLGTATDVMQKDGPARRAIRHRRQRVGVHARRPRGSARTCFGSSSFERDNGGEMRVFAKDLQFPEGPVWVGDGSVLVVEIRRKTLTRCWPDGRKTIVANLGGGPTVRRSAPTAIATSRNNGGFSFTQRADGRWVTAGTPDDYVDRAHRSREPRDRQVGGALRQDRRPTDSRPQRSRHRCARRLLVHRSRQDAPSRLGSRQRLLRAGATARWSRR